MRALLVKQGGTEENLVEEIPGSLIAQCAGTLFGQNVVPRIIHVIASNLADVLLAPKYLIHALVGRVVVHVAHDKDLSVFVESEQRVLNSFCLSGTDFPVVRSIEAAGEVADDEAHRFAGQRAAYGEEAARGEARVLFCRGNVRYEFDSLHLEHLGIVE